MPLRVRSGRPRAINMINRSANCRPGVSNGPRFEFQIGLLDLPTESRLVGYTRGRMRKRFVGTFFGGGGGKGSIRKYNWELKIHARGEIIVNLIKRDSCSWNYFFFFLFFGNYNLNLGRIKSVEIVDFF